MDLAFLVEGPDRVVSPVNLDLADALADLGARGRAGEFGGLFEDLPDSGGRAAVEARALEDAAGQVASVPLLEGRSVAWKRSPLGQPDTLTVRIGRGRIPVPIDTVEGVQVAIWLYTHDGPEDCKSGDPGQFVGVATKIGRQGDDLVFTCSDMTALPIAEEVPPGVLEGLDLNLPLWRVVENLIQTMPSGDSWRVVPRGRVAEGIVPGVALAEERITRIPAKGGVRNTASPELVAAGKLIAAGFTDGPINFSQTDLRNPVSVAALEAEGLDAKITADLVSTIRTGRASLPASAFSFSASYQTSPARIRRTVIPPRVQDIFGAGRLKYWEAVRRLCSLMAVVPEVAILEDGSVGIALIDAEELQQGGHFRRFERDGKGYRVLTLGATCTLMQEERDLVLGRRYDRIVVVSPNPETGITLTAEAGRESKDGATSERTEILTVPRVTDPEHLQRIARAAWIDLASGEYRVRVSVPRPWTDGGSEESPDLLWCGVGAVVVLRLDDLRSEYGGATGNATSFEELLRAAGVPAKAAEILAAAAERRDGGLIFQVAGIEHAADGDKYLATLTLQRFLGGATRKLLERYTTGTDTAQTLTREEAIA